MHRPIRILGIDPGLRRTGWGMVTIEGNRLGFLACGSLATDGAAGLAARLLAIHDGLRQVVHEHAPDEAAVEATIVNKDASATLKLGQARGAAIGACVARDLPVSEYAARQVKLAVVGSGGADKAQVQHMVGLMLGLQGKLQADAADALAVAITHAHVRATANRLGVDARAAWGRR